MQKESIFTMDTSKIKFGSGATREIGFDMAELGARRVMMITDPRLSKSEPVTIAQEALYGAGVEAALYDQVRIEPTDISFKHAIDFAMDGGFDGFVAVGGGSTIDTAKAANLYSSYPADFLTYVNSPIGEGKPIPGKLKPLIAIPTTAGTGSETTGVAIFDFTERHVKTGISHRALSPALGVIDPENTRSLPKMVAACTGLDVLCHALESLTAIPFNERPQIKHPNLRTIYQGANPISHLWASRSIELVSQYLLRVLDDPTDHEARSNMLLASTYAGIGFGNSGVHLPHAMSYPVAGMVRDYIPEDYPKDYPIVPHGMAVALNAPAVFRLTARANPKLHLYAAELMGADTSNADASDASEILSRAITDLMRKAGLPNGLSAIGFDTEDIDGLVDGISASRRLIKVAPLEVDEADLQALFLDSLVCWQ